MFGVLAAAGGGVRSHRPERVGLCVLRECLGRSMLSWKGTYQFLCSLGLCLALCFCVVCHCLSRTSVDERG